MNGYHKKNFTIYFCYNIIHRIYLNERNQIENNTKIYGPIKDFNKIRMQGNYRKKVNKFYERRLK